MTPTLKYPGAKWRLAPWLLRHMPQHETYLEPYFGSGALFFQKPKARIETINDLDGEVVNFFRTCREHPEELAEAVSLTPWARGEFEAALHPTASPADNVERARRFAVRCWMAFGASTQSTGWRHTTGNKRDGGPDNPKLWRRLPAAIQTAAERLLDAQIENRSALELLQRIDGPEVLAYIDPPYVPATRTAHRDQYRHEMKHQDHVVLLEALQGYSGMVMLSGYDCQLYQDLLPHWRCVTTKTQAERGVTRQECLWLNPRAVERLETQLKL